MTAEDPAAASAPAALALYHYDGCPFCTLVRQEIDALDIAVELRDIMREPAHAQRLIEARGRRTVPVLEITDQQGGTHLMPESRDIVAWLRARDAEGRLSALRHGSRGA